MTTNKATQPLTEVPPLAAEMPAFPLTLEKRAAYQALYATYQAAMDSTTDPVVLTAIDPSYLDVGQLLTKDHIYTLSRTTENFTELKEQFVRTNDGIETLAVQIAATSAHFAEAATILAVINKAVPYFTAL